MYYWSYTIFIVWFPLSGGIRYRTWQGCILGPQLVRLSKLAHCSVQFVNGQSLCIGWNSDWSSIMQNVWFFAAWNTNGP